MNAKLAELKDQAMSLPESDRETLAFDLIDSLSDPPYPSSEVEAWGRRLEDLKTGRIKGLSLAAFQKEVSRP